MNKKKLICIVLVLVLAITSIAAVIIIRAKGIDHPIAQITQQGQLIKTIDLTQVTDAYEFNIENPNGGYNTVRVEPGQIAIIDASCPDHVCVHTGFISDSLVPITCLPNEVIIKIKASKSASGLDAISQ